MTDLEFEDVIWTINALYNFNHTAVFAAGRGKSQSSKEARGKRQEPVKQKPRQVYRLHVDECWLWGVSTHGVLASNS